SALRALSHPFDRGSGFGRGFTSTVLQVNKMCEVKPRTNVSQKPEPSPNTSLAIASPRHPPSSILHLLSPIPPHRREHSVRLDQYSLRDLPLLRLEPDAVTLQSLQVELPFLVRKQFVVGLSGKRGDERRTFQVDADCLSGKIVLAHVLPHRGGIGERCR